MNIAAYCRVSTDKEDQQNSLVMQKAFFAQYIQKTGDKLVKLYADEGISGTKIKNRKEFLQMMADAEDGLFEQLVVKDISRFARNTVDLLTNIRKLKLLGIETIFVNGNMIGMGNSEFVLTIFGALAQEESANTSKRIKFGKKMNAQKGRVPNLVYGYDKTIGDYFHLTINEKESQVIRQIYKWYLEDGYGAQKISNLLNDKHCRTKRNCKWSQNAVCRILTNELYTGKILNGKEEVTDFLTGQRTQNDKTQWLVRQAPELQIIDDDTYNKVQKLLQAKQATFQNLGKRHSSKHLFSTIIQCEECKWSFRRITRTYQNTYVRWICSGHNGKGADSCPNQVSIDEEELIETLQDYFISFFTSKERTLERVIALYQKNYEKKKEDSLTQRDINKQQFKLNAAREKYLELYADNLISRDELNQKLKSITDELEILKKKIVIEHSKEEVSEILRRQFVQTDSFFDLHQMNNLQLKRILKVIEVNHEGNVNIVLNSFVSTVRKKDILT